MDKILYNNHESLKASLIQNEHDIKILVGDDPEMITLKHFTDRKFEELEELLISRQWFLNQMFEFTPGNLAMIKSIDGRLRTLSVKLHERVKAMDEKSKLILDDPDFDDDFEIEGTLEFCYNSKESVLKLEDDEFYGSDFNLMISALHSFYLAQGRYYYYVLDISSKSVNLDDDIDWNDMPLLHPELNICFATHNLCCHKLYAIPDLLRLNDFWSEVRFTERSLTDSMGNLYNPNEGIKTNSYER